MEIFELSGNIVDIHKRRVFSGTISVENGFISNIVEDTNNYDTFIMPGFIDSHIHIESSMLIPSEFAREAVKKGTVATVSDPHEIANVCGMAGIDFMLKNGKATPFKFYFGAPSCVPATTFETAGAEITASDIEILLNNPDIKYLSEMMNYPGVLYGFPDVAEKLAVAKKLGKPIDGHAPGLKGEMAGKYISAGISTDHECYSLEEALDKIKYGMKILIREGSAAKNFDSLKPLIKTNTDRVMLCSDDKHPDDLVEGHINQLVKQAVAEGYDFFDIMQTAVINPVEHYKLDVGMLRIGDEADFIVVDNLTDLNVLKTYINGIVVAENGATLIDSVFTEPINNFNCSRKSTDDFKIEATTNKIKVIEALEGQLITKQIEVEAKIQDNNYVCDIENDILKIAVVNRYDDSKPAVAFIKNFGLRKGAIAGSIGHDSHNIIAVGTSDEMLAKAVNVIIENKGGIVAVDENEELILQLPVAGLMSLESAEIVGRKYQAIDHKAKQLGSTLKAPFMTLSFMALLVIPSIKLSDKGLFDGTNFEFINLAV